MARDQPDLSGVVAEWAAAVADTSFVELTGEALRQRLRGLAERLVDALRAEPFDDRPGHDVGVALVDLHVTKVDGLRRSIAVLAKLPGAGDSAGEPDRDRDRMGRLLGALAAGFAEAMQERTLAEQETIRAAALAARTKAEEALRAGEARVRAVFDAAAVAVAIGDLEGRLVEANPALAEMLGVPVEELAGRRVLDFFHPDDAADIQQQIYERLAAGDGAQVRLEKRFLRADGEVGWTMLAVSLVHNPDGSPAYLVAMGEDVTERHRLQGELHHQAHHDPLTGLPNRTLLYQWLAEAVRDAQPRCRAGLCFLDLDDFKAVNDTLGHGTGDRLLKAVADRLNACVAGAGHVIARVGGDEFVAFVRPTDGPGPVTDMAEALLETLTAPFQVDGHELSVSASIGVVEGPVAGGDPEEVLRAADATLYWAKADGRARWALYDPARNSDQMVSYSLANALPAAIDRGEFMLEYQPIVALADGRVRGVEALVRWRHPELGVLPPDRFIPLAERSGQIVRLGRWVLREACIQAGVWQDRHADPPFVSVNLSMRQCTDSRLLADVTEALADSGLQAEHLVLELTESTVMRPDGDAAAALDAIAKLGVRVAIDDFGTGYSNLARLRTLPVHLLKLPGLGAGDDELITGMLVTLGRSLGLTVIAESVETAAQAATLRALGCDLAQGWYFAAPGSPDDVQCLLASAYGASQLGT